MGISEMVKGIDPTRMQTGDSEVFRKMFDKTMQTIQSIIVGNWVRQANRLYLEGTEQPIKQAKGWREKMYRDVPYVQNSLKDMISVFGNPVVPDQSRKNFFPFHSADDVDPVAVFYTQHGVYPSAAKEFDVINPETRESYTIQDDELYEFAVYRGQLLRMFADKYKGLVDNLDPELKPKAVTKLKDNAQKISKSVMGLPQEQRKKMMQSILNGKVDLDKLIEGDTQ